MGPSGLRAGRVQQGAVESFGTHYLLASICDHPKKKQMYDVGMLSSGTHLQKV